MFYKNTYIKLGKQKNTVQTSYGTIPFLFSKGRLFINVGRYVGHLDTGVIWGELSLSFLSSEITGFPLNRSASRQSVFFGKRKFKSFAHEYRTHLELELFTM